jgi:hypothetical protein
VLPPATAAKEVGEEEDAMVHARVFQTPKPDAERVAGVRARARVHYTVASPPAEQQ